MSAASHERAAAAIKEGRLTDEIVPVSIPQRKGDPIVVETDEGVRPGTTAESLGKLRAGVRRRRHHHRRERVADQRRRVGGRRHVRARRRGRGVDPLGVVVSYGMVAGPDNPSLNLQPANAIREALSKTDLTIDDVDLFELNEAFAAVGIASAREMGISLDIVNVNGGAIALGHPIGMSGNRLALTMLHELRRRGGGVGAAALCGGGGQGDAIVLRTL